MTFVSRLLELFGGLAPRAPAVGGDEKLAMAALLVHVAEVDGRFAASERERLIALFETQFGLAREAAERFVEEAQRLDREAGDVASLVEMIGRDASEAERRRLLAAAYAVARSDGRVLEFEDDIVWRVGRLLGLGDAAIAAIRDAPAPDTAA